jgi:NAD(P)-dependent dehydrogenase (short-subunit alcohol dehydrogenase family)
MAAPDSDLAGRVALVTGGGSGIGAAVSRRLAAEGCRVVVADIDGDNAKAVAEEVGGRPLTIDVGDVAAWGPAVDGIVGEEGGIDIAHLNAGVATGEADITALTDDQYQRVLGANLHGVVYGTRAVARAMKAAGTGGSIVATASIAGIIGFGPDPIYTLTKHAVVGLVRASAGPLGGYGITINCICPGVVDTPLIGDAGRMMAQAGYQLIPPSDVADAVVRIVRGGGSGEAWTILPWEDPAPFEFAAPVLTPPGWTPPGPG